MRALVIAPPLPGAGERVLSEGAVREFWYQSFHRLPLAERLLDGNLTAARAYLEHFWAHWSGPGYTPDPGELDRLAEVYGAPGAFTASIGWYRAGSGTVARSLAEQAAGARGSDCRAHHRAVARPRPPLPGATGATASRSSSVRRRCGRCPTPDTSRRWRRRQSSPQRSPRRSGERLMSEPIRRAGAEDADVVARLLRDFNVEYDDPAPPQEQMAERIRALLAHGDTDHPGRRASRRARCR